MRAKFDGFCKGCKSRFSAGAEVTWSRDTGVTACPNCADGSAPAPERTAADRAEAPRDPQANGYRRGPICTMPTEDEADAAFNALAGRLDDDQRAIFNARPENLRVLAGAGSGKTTTVVAWLARLWREGHVAPGRTVATTFTAKAGRELFVRLSRVAPFGALDAGDPGRAGTARVGTFHALAGRALRAMDKSRWDGGRNLDGQSRTAGLPSSGMLWRKIIGWAGGEGVPGLGVDGLGLEDVEPRAYALAIDVLRSRGIVGNALVKAAREVEIEQGLPRLGQATEMFLAAKEKLRAWDFADTLQAYLDALRAGDLKNGADLVVVDEAQDNSFVQLQIARLLARHGSLVLIGDVRQSIYGWRGAFPAMLANADREIGAGTLYLTKNYRSGSEIVAVGNRCAAGQSWNVGQPSAPARDCAGAVTVAGYPDTAAEADGVAQQIRASLDEGEKLDEGGEPTTAILCRTNAAAAEFEAALVAAAIPVVRVGGVPFFARADVQDALAYARLALGDDLDALGRIVNKPRRYLGAAFVARVKSHGGPILVAMNDLVSTFGRNQRDGVRDLASFLVQLRATPWPEQIDAIVKLLTPVVDHDTDADDDKSGVINAVATVARRFASAAEFLAFAARCAGEVAEAKGSEANGYEIPEGRVVISTIHRAKGLEWRTVYVSASATVFPHARCANDEERLAEERRLFYVAATRAKDSLRASWSALNLYGKKAGPSAFLAFLADAENGPTDPMDPTPHGGEPKPTPAVEPAPKSKIVDQILAERTGVHVGASAGERLFGPAWRGVLADAAEQTAAMPAAAAGEGGRYVPVAYDEFRDLLAPAGFVEAPEVVGTAFGQRVMEARFNRKHGALVLRVYTSIPPTGAEAREVGEDSIKVAALWETPGHDESGFAADKSTTRPLHKRLPYACRTRGWRETLLKRIDEVAKVVEDAKACPKCGSPTVQRQPRGSARVFNGCVRYPECNGSR
jgi:DNA helicase-2/ATP-dependent DNA helicase PcrA